MPASTSISNKALLPAALFAALWACSAPALAADENKAGQAEEDDFSSTPFTAYGEFNEEAEEIAESRFFQYGRYFGVSVGVGGEGVTENRGLLWQGGFPMFEFKVHYWFDFNVAIDMGLSTANHFYDNPVTGDHVDVNFVRIGISGKYYFDTANLSAAISFANPYLIVGFGSYRKSEKSRDLELTENDDAVGFSFGAGLEFALKHRKVYFEVEGKMHLAAFKDTFTREFEPSIPNLSGGWFTITGALLFTW
jgi:hypothetical protein